MDQILVRLNLLEQLLLRLMVILNVVMGRLVHMLHLITIPEVILFRVQKVLDLLIGCLWKRRLSSSCCATMIKLVVLLAKAVLWCGLFKMKLVHLSKLLRLDLIQTSALL